MTTTAHGNEVIAGFLTVFAGLFPIVNPPATSMIFLAMTEEATTSVRRELARRVAVYSFAILVVSLYLGAFALAFFGVSEGALRVAGGLVLALTGWRLLDAPPKRSEAEISPQKAPSDLVARAFYPLTMPLTTGPGTMAVSVALGTRGLDRPGEIVGSLLAVTVICALIFGCYWYSDRLRSALSEAGSDALGRIFAFVLVCIGVQVLWSGFATLSASLPREAR